MVHYQIESYLSDGIITQILPIYESNAVSMLIYVQETDEYIVNMIHIWPQRVFQSFIGRFPSLDIIYIYIYNLLLLQLLFFQIQYVLLIPFRNQRHYK